MVGVVLAAAVALGDPRPVPWAPELHVGDRAPDVALVDQRGRPFRFADLRGHTVVLSFIATGCGDLCPLITARFAQLAALERLNDRVRLLEVSIDPDRDRPKLLAAYAARFGVDGARWSLATGEREEVLAFAARFGAAPEAASTSGIAHEGRTVVIDADGIVQAELDGVNWRAADVAALASGSSSLPWWTRAWARICGGVGNPYEVPIIILASLALLGCALAALLRGRSRTPSIGVRG